MKKQKLSLIFYVLVLSSAVLSHGYPSALDQSDLVKRQAPDAATSTIPSATGTFVTAKSKRDAELPRNDAKRQIEAPRNDTTKRQVEVPKNSTKRQVDAPKNGTKRQIEAPQNSTKRQVEVPKNSTKRQAETPKNGTNKRHVANGGVQEKTLTGQGEPNLPMSLDSGPAKQNIHKRNLVGLANSVRNAGILNDIDENVDAGEQKQNIRKRNLVGLSQKLREAMPVIAGDQGPHLEADVGETKKNIRRRNLVGMAAHQRDYVDAKGRQSVVDPIANEVEEESEADDIDDISEDDSLIMRKKKNPVAEAVARILRGAPAHSNPIAEAKKLRDSDTQYYRQQELDLPIDVEPGKPKQNIKRSNLVGLSQRHREAMDSNKLDLDISLDSPVKQPNNRRQTVGSKNQSDNKVGMNNATRRKRGKPSRAAAAGKKVGKAHPVEIDLEKDSGERKQNILRRNLVGLSEHQREVAMTKAMTDFEADVEEAKRNSRQVKVEDTSPGSSNQASGQATYLNTNMQVDAGEPKENIRKRSNMMSKVSQERPLSMDSSMDGVEEFSEGDMSKRQRTRGMDEEEEVNMAAAAKETIEKESHEGGHHAQSSGAHKPLPEDYGHPAPARAPSPLPEPSERAGKPAIRQTEQSVPAEIKNEKPLTSQSDDQNSRAASYEKDNGYSLAKEEAQQGDIADKVVEGGKDQSFTLFTIANTDIGADYRKIPYRERYLWDKRDAPCHSFNLKIPDELAEKSLISLCIYRPNLEFPDETKMFIMNVGAEEVELPQQKVFGYVVNKAVSSVYGRIVDRFFYGEVSVYNEETKSTYIYVVEEINLLNRLMRNNQKTLKHMLMVMNGKGKEKMRVVFNAVVTKGASLIDFMVFTNPNDINRNPFIMLSTNHNSYICPGEPMMQVDENGQIELGSSINRIVVENDGSVRMTTREKSYTFRPHGRTIITEGMQVRTLQEHEGSVAISAFTTSSSYDCVLPTPAFQAKRRGGYVCKVCVAIDDLFTKHYINKNTANKETASNYLIRIIDRVSWMLRSIDLNEDRKPDNIGLDYDSQSLKWTYPDNDNEDLTEQDVEVLFESLGAYDFADCCLGIGYTMKNFPNSGFARRPSNPGYKRNKIVPSGVCAGKTGRIPNNLMIISANNKKGKYGPISEKQLIYLTASQIAGAFGAAPDGAGDDVCDQFIDERKQARHYLMWPDVLRNTTLKEQSLSSCSKKDIVRTLSTCKSSCLDVDRHPFCGNGIVEEGEECDCGSEYNCKLQTCCYSRVGKHPCRKSGVGCKANSAPSSLVLEKGFTFLTLSLLVSISHITF